MAESTDTMWKAYDCNRCWAAPNFDEPYTHPCSSDHAVRMFVMDHFMHHTEAIYESDGRCEVTCHKCCTSIHYSRDMIKGV